MRAPREAQAVGSIAESLQASGPDPAGRRKVQTSRGLRGLRGIARNDPAGGALLRHVDQRETHRDRGVFVSPFLPRFSEVALQKLDAGDAVDEALLAPLRPVPR